MPSSEPSSRQPSSSAQPSSSRGPLFDGGIRSARPGPVVTVGHAIVDVLAPSTDDDVARAGLAKGTMSLVDAARAASLYRELSATTEVSGGSAANTAAALASFGASVIFVGKVCSDELGRIFAHDIRSAGVSYDVAPAVEGPPTGRCLVMVTPDAERTMSTYLGASDNVYPEDLPTQALVNSSVVYVEGYLYGLEATESTMREVEKATHSGGSRLAVSLSDPYWVELHRDALVVAVDDADIVFGNEQEACGLFETEDLDEALRELSARCEVVTITRGIEGALVVFGGETTSVPAYRVERVVDTTGAGDLYAAGFLFGLTTGLSPQRCAALGALAASEVITHIGARNLVSMRSLAVEAGLLDGEG